MIAAGASSYSDPTRTEIQAFGFIIAIFIGIGVLVLCMPGWIILGIKAFKGNDDIRTEESSKEEHIIEDISREEAVERMKERYRQDAERGNEQGE